MTDRSASVSVYSTYTHFYIYLCIVKWILCVVIFHIVRFLFSLCFVVCVLFTELLVVTILCKKFYICIMDVNMNSTKSACEKAFHRRVEYLQRVFILRAFACFMASNILQAFYRTKNIIYFVVFYFYLFNRIFSYFYSYNILIVYWCVVNRLCTLNPEIESKPRFRSGWFAPIFPLNFMCFVYIFICGW